MLDLNVGECQGLGETSEVQVNAGYLAARWCHQIAKQLDQHFLAKD